MSKPEQNFALPLEYAAQIAFELHSMRRECSEFAAHLMCQRPMNERGLEECARLDEALARAHALLRQAVNGIKDSQARRRRTNK